MANNIKFTEYTQRELKIINLLFSPYLFYEDLNSKTRRCICTACGQEYEVTSNSYDIFTACHNDEVICERCKRTVKAKSKGKAKSCKNLYEEHRVVVIHRIDANKIEILADVAYKRYYNGIYNPQVDFYKSSRYILQPGKARHFDWLWYHKEWFERKKIGEPFYIKNNGGCFWYEPDNSYNIIGMEKLNNTFLKYQLLDEYEDEQIQRNRHRRIINFKEVSYLCHFAEHPQIEVLQKLGYYEIVRNLVELNNKSYPYVNWNADTLTGFFKMTKQELKEFRKINGDYNLLKLFWVMKKHFKSKKPLQDAVKIRSEIKGAIISSEADFLREAISDIKRNKLSIIETVRYLIKQQEKKGDFDTVRREYFDYYRMANDLNYDFTIHNVLYPPNLKRAHDLANETHIVWLEEKKAKEEAERDKKAQKMLRKKDIQYYFTDGKYLITVPHSTKEILEEGRRQQHCVGGYAGRHIEGKLTICFLRKVKEPQKPFYTIEMHGKSLTQVQGFNNRTPLTPQAKVFFDKWLKWVSLGSKRDSDGNPILEKLIQKT